MGIGRVPGEETVVRPKHGTGTLSLAPFFWSKQVTKPGQIQEMRNKLQAHVGTEYRKRSNCGHFFNLWQLFLPSLNFPQSYPKVELNSRKHTFCDWL